MIKIRSLYCEEARRVDDAGDEQEGEGRSRFKALRKAERFTFERIKGQDLVRLRKLILCSVALTGPQLKPQD